MLGSQRGRAPMPGPAGPYRDIHAEVLVAACSAPVD
jgi:hypothetical protein